MVSRSSLLKANNTLFRCLIIILKRFEYLLFTTEKIQNTTNDTRFVYSVLDVYVGCTVDSSHAVGQQNSQASDSCKAEKNTLQKHILC